jgi:hypothetical protein
MRPAAKKYTTAYKKRVDVERDTYIPRRALKEPVQCAGCGAFYYHRRWTLTLPREFRGPLRFHRIYCPACRKIKEQYPSGELQLMDIDGAERGDIARILRNEEERAREKNPLERIMRVEAANGNWRIETTTEKLAQRLGRSIKKARGGELIYKWSHNNKFVRVFWQKKSG